MLMSFSPCSSVTLSEIKYFKKKKKLQVMFLMTFTEKLPYLHGCFTAIAASSAQFAIVPVSPGPDHVIVC